MSMRGRECWWNGHRKAASMGKPMTNNGFGSALGLFRVQRFLVNLGPFFYNEGWGNKVLEGQPGSMGPKSISMLTTHQGVGFDLANLTIAGWGGMADAT